MKHAKRLASMLVLTVLLSLSAKWYFDGYVAIWESTGDVVGRGVVLFSPVGDGCIGIQADNGIWSVSVDFQAYCQ